MAAGGGGKAFSSFPLPLFLSPLLISPSLSSLVCLMFPLFFFLFSISLFIPFIHHCLVSPQPLINLSTATPCAAHRHPTRSGGVSISNFLKNRSSLLYQLCSSMQPLTVLIGLPSSGHWPSCFILPAKRWPVSDFVNGIASIR